MAIIKPFSEDEREKIRKQVQHYTPEVRDVVNRLLLIITEQACQLAGMSAEAEQANNDGG